MTWNGRRVLVTGAGGFIGSHLVAALVQRGAMVRALVHYNSRNDIGQLQFLTDDQRERVEFVLGDIQDSGCVRDVVADCSHVFHLAALIGIPYSYVAPRSYVSTNVVGTLNVLDAVRQAGTLRMIHTSTSEVYGTALYEPIDEQHPLRGQSPYSASKIGADKLVESYHRSFDVPVVTVRPFNTYGPRQSARAVIPTIISQLLSGCARLELGSLDPQRDFTFVEDTAAGFIAAAECEQAIGQTVNIGTGKTIRIGDLCRMLIEMINPAAAVAAGRHRVRPDNSEVMKLICDNRKAEQLLGWQPQVTLREGLARTIEFIREHAEVFARDGYVV